MTQVPPLCRDCKFAQRVGFFRPRVTAYSRCMHPNSARQPCELVVGAGDPAAYDFCTNMRGFASCDRQGRLFEPVPS